MTPTLKFAAGALVLGLVGSAASAQACACGSHHHRHHATRHYAPARYAAPVRYERRVVRGPVYVRSYDSAYYGGGYYYGGSPYYTAPYAYTVVRPAYSYWRPSPVVVSYSDGYYWRHHHHRHHDWDDRGWRRGWDHGHWRD